MNTTTIEGFIEIVDKNEKLTAQVAQLRAELAAAQRRIAELETAVLDLWDHRTETLRDITWDLIEELDDKRQAQK